MLMLTPQFSADTDDQIDFKVGGSDLAKLTDGQLTLTSATASRPGILLESTNGPQSTLPESLLKKLLRQ